jgi:hypothetical protein
MKEPSENAVHLHPSDEALVAVIREGMRADEAEQILIHLDSCPACEQRLEAIEPLLRRYRKMRAETFPKLPSWRGLEHAMDRIDARKSPSRVRRPAWAGVIAAGAAICGFLLWPTSRQAELRAATLLREAQRTEVVGLKRRLKVKTPAGSFVRPAVLHGNLAADTVAARFTSARYDWTDPLGPDSYVKWQDTLKSKKVKVTEKDGEARIQTDTRESDLVEASFTIAENNMRVIAGRFEFSDRLLVEIAAIPDSIEEPSEPAVSATPSAPGSSARFIHTLPERELLVWTAIDRMNLGAGAPISVDAGPGDRILITAYQLDETQERELRAHLSNIEGVTLERSSNEPTVSAKAADSAIEISESIVSRAHLLDRLANRFPASTVEAFTLPDRRTLWELRTRGVTLLNKDIEALGNKLAKVLTLSEPAISDAPSSTQALVESATIVDRLVTALFTAVNPVAERNRLPDEFSKLKQRSLEYSRSLGEEPSR